MWNWMKSDVSDNMSEVQEKIQAGVELKSAELQAGQRIEVKLKSELELSQ